MLAATPLSSFWQHGQQINSGLCHLQEVNPARVVVAQDGTPLWRFADADGIWRYPVTIEDVSPRYLEALINYEDRWFWKHPG